MSLGITCGKAHELGISHSVRLGSMICHTVDLGYPEYECGSTECIGVVHTLGKHLVYEDIRLCSGLLALTVYLRTAAVPVNCEALHNCCCIALRRLCLDELICAPLKPLNADPAACVCDKLRNGSCLCAVGYPVNTAAEYDAAAL